MYYFRHNIRIFGLIFCFVLYAVLQLISELSLPEALTFYVVISVLILADLAFGQGLSYSLIRPSLWFASGHFLFMVLGSLRFFTFVEHTGSVTDNDLIDSMMIVICAALLFQVGYYISSKLENNIASKSILNNDKRALTPDISRFRIVVVLLSATCIGFCTQIFNLMQLNHSLYLLNLGNVLAAIVSLVGYYELLSKQQSTKIFNFFLFIILAINFIGATFVVSRYIYFYVLAVFCVLYYYRKVIVLQGRIQIFSVAIFGIVIYLFGSFTKTIGMSEKVDAPVSDELVQRLLSVDFLDAFDNFSRILVETRISDPYHITPGSFLLHPIVNLIPRDIWVDKPRALSTVLGETWYPQIEGLSLASSLLGELVANFGITISIFSYGALGFLFRRFDKLAHSKMYDLSFICVTAMSCYYSFMMSRGDFLLSAIYVYLVLGFVFIWKVIKQPKFHRLRSNL